MINSRTRDKKGRDSEEFKLLKDLIELFGILGMSKQYVSELCELAISESKPPKRRNAKRWQSVSYDNIIASASAMYLWHRDKSYLTVDAKPIPLPLLGKKKASVESLVKRCDQNVDAKALAREMIPLNYLRSAGKGKYLPKAIYGQLQPLRPLGAAHCLRSLRTMVWNFRSNLTEKTKDPLLERNAIVSRLSAKDVQAFKDFSRQQGYAAMGILSDWLEAKQKNANSVPDGNRRRSSDVHAGVHIFAYTSKLK